MAGKLRLKEEAKKGSQEIQDSAKGGVQQKKTIQIPKIIFSY